MDAATVSGARKAANKYNVPLATVLAVTQQESGGKALTPIRRAGVTRNLPLVRWEGHYFHRRTSGRLRETAVRMGLASPKAGGIPNPSKQQDRWEKLLTPAINLASEPAYQSFSAGVGQVMGSHYDKLGFPSSQDMFEYQAGGVDQQIDVMMRYCEKFNLIDELQRGDFKGFERGYNGPAAGGVYARGIEALARKYAKEYPDGQRLDGIPVTSTKRATNSRSMLRQGTKGAKVRELQSLLLRAGYAVKVDGDYGPSTKQAVEDYQSANGLEPDGIAGPQTMAKLDALKRDPGEAPGQVSTTQAMTQTSEGKTGGMVAGTGFGLATAQQGVQEVMSAVYPTGTGGFTDKVYLVCALLGVALTLAGIGMIIWGKWKANNRTEGVMAV